VAAIAVDLLLAGRSVLAFLALILAVAAWFNASDVADRKRPWQDSLVNVVLDNWTSFIIGGAISIFLIMVVAALATQILVIGFGIFGIYFSATPWR
jgi:hypothetical protein